MRGHTAGQGIGKENLLLSAPAFLPLVANGDRTQDPSSIVRPRNRVIATINYLRFRAHQRCAINTFSSERKCNAPAK
jgi:hypothetical protein